MPVDQTYQFACCAVCGDRVNGCRYGAPACLGCIVFFRRAICKNAKYKCAKSQDCVINNESRCICRFCRLQKCLSVGMNPGAIQRRDVMGPRKKKYPSFDEQDASCQPSTSDCSDSTAPSPQSIYLMEGLNMPLLSNLVKLQHRQRSEHFSTACMMEEGLGCGMDMFDDIRVLTKSPPLRRARKKDVNFMLKTGLTDACEWAMQFAPFKESSSEVQKAILREFGLAFMLVDQGMVTLRQDEPDCWMLQNNSYMCPDYLKGLPEEDRRLKEVPTKVKLHPIFVQDAIDSVGLPMKGLNMDDVEAAAIKTILLFSHTHSADKNFFGPMNFKVLNGLQCRLISELMTYCRHKSPEDAIERMGSVILLTSSIRCTIRSLYNQTRVSDVFNLMTFDSIIREVYLM